MVDDKQEDTGVRSCTRACIKFKRGERHSCPHIASKSNCFFFCRCQVGMAYGTIQEGFFRLFGNIFLLIFFYFKRAFYRLTWDNSYKTSLVYIERQREEKHTKNAAVGEASRNAAEQQTDVMEPTTKAQKKLKIFIRERRDYCW